MNKLSPWALSASRALAGNTSEIVYSKSIGDYTFSVYQSSGSLWIVATWPNAGKIAFRAAYSPGDFEITGKQEHGQGLEIKLISAIGAIKVHISFIDADYPVLRYTTTLKPAADLQVPFWPRDIIVPGNDGNAENTAGKIHTKQVGTRSGLVFLSMTRPKAGAVVYLQNLTALADYCQETETSCSDVVGGEWPELGFFLPPNLKKPLPAGKEVVISDAFVAFDRTVANNEPELTKQYLNMLGAIYLELPRPDSNYQHWPAILDKGIKDLVKNPGCWSQVKGKSYINAYVSDYATPPEIMVQLAVLLPLLDYVEWSGTELEVMKTIKDGLPEFYSPETRSIMRWLPAVQDQLEGEEEQKQPMVMDSWYLHHPLLNLSRLALKGDKVAEQLFVDSLEFAIKVAHHFKYRWPVFYKMDTLEVVKAETKPGEGGEKDVAGLYTHIMLQALELTGDKRYLHEAEKAAKTLQGLGFDLFYQANNTAFSAGALLRLWKITKNETYLDLSYLCIANIMNNVRLWDCNYGYGKNFPSFFCLFPLSDAPYTAVYEEQEVFCALHDYLKHAEGEEILPSVTLFASEYIRYLVDRAVFYYPTMLPKEMLSTEVKIGEVVPDLWIALEDMHDGWEQCGQVGQEVYGAGNAFGILPRHYFKIPGQNFMLFIDYPVAGFSIKRKTISFKILGNPRINCRLRMVKTEREKLPDFTININGKPGEIMGKKVEDGQLEYILSGMQQITLSWK